MVKIGRHMTKTLKICCINVPLEYYVKIMFFIDFWTRINRFSESSLEFSSD